MAAFQILSSHQEFGSSETVGVPVAIGDTELLKRTPQLWKTFIGSSFTHLNVTLCNTSTVISSVVTICNQMSCSEDLDGYITNKNKCIYWFQIHSVGSYIIYCFSIHLCCIHFTLKVCIIYNGTYIIIATQVRKHIIRNFTQGIDCNACIWFVTVVSAHVSSILSLIK